MNITSSGKWRKQMPLFRKKPVVIEAFKWGVLDVPEKGWLGNDHMAQWMGDAFDGIKSVARGESILGVMTLEGPIYARLGDWIVKGIKGEFYPVRPDIFEASYETVIADQPLPADYGESAE